MTKFAWIQAAMKAAWTLTGTPENLAYVPEPIAHSMEKICTEESILGGWRECSAMEASIGRLEGGFRQVPGDCPGMKPGSRECTAVTATSFGFMQHHFQRGENKTSLGYSMFDLLGDSDKAARQGRQDIKDSILAAPADGPPEKALWRYAGKAMAKARWDLAQRILKEVSWPTES